MKAEERHQLKENDLASWFQYGLPLFLKRNGSYIMLVLAMCLLGYVLWQRHVQNVENTQMKAWTELEQATMNEDPIGSLKAVIDTYDIKEIRQNAYLKLAAEYNNLVLRPMDLKTLSLTRSDALANAYENYKKVLSDYGTDDMIAAKAIVGMAGVEEGRDEWDQAKKLYEQLADKNGRFANSAIADLGDKMLKTLDDRRNAPWLSHNLPTQPSTRNSAGLPGRLGGIIPDVTTGPATGPATPEPSTMPEIQMPEPGASPFNPMGPVIPREATTTTAPGK